LLLLLLSLGITLSLPFVQTKIGTYVTNKLNESYKTDIKIEQVSITIFGGVKLKKVMIKDHHIDTLIYANRIKTNILSFNKLYNGDLFFGDIRIDGLLFNLKTYKGDTDSNIDKFIALFDTGKPSTRPFVLNANNAYLTNSHFRIIDENLVQPKNLDLTKIDASLSNFKIFGPDVNTKINLMAFKDHRGLNVDNLSTLFTYTKKNILLKDLEIKTKHSFFNGNAALYYKREDFSDFNNKVKFDVQIDEYVLATNDIRYFYDELGKNQIFNIRSHVKGTLNNLNFNNLNLIDGKNQQIIGNVNFKNLLGKGNQQFYMKGNFSKVSANYKDLTSLLPNVLGKNLPSSMQKLGQFNLTGYAEITTTSIQADISIKTILGNVKSNLMMTNINQIDNASYIGNVILQDFNIGSFLERKDIGRVSLNFDVIGKGFTEKLLNTSASGKVSKFYFNKYNYSNIVVNGNFKSPFFKGKLTVNDPNLLMDFEGLVDISKKENKYDFHTKIDYANLNKLHFMSDSISIFKGDIKMDISGNSIDNLQGIVNVNQTSYQNAKDNYIFDDFVLSSTFDENRVRTITINSPDIIEGKVVGKFQFNQLQKMVENAAGSLYANYSPNKIKKGQFLKFNFSIYNKVIEIFYPGVEVGANTVIKGNINSDNDEFKLNFDSPSIKAFDNNFDKIKVDIDNKNPLYNAYIEMDSIKTKYYKISNFSLINVTAKDTLFVRSEFKGGKNAEDYYNLNLYHTIDKENNSVVGIQKSELKFKDYLWFLNENNLDNNKIVFDKKLKNFSIDNILMTHEKQKIALMGKLRDTTYKDLELNFENVNLGKIIPSVDRLKVVGNLNGKINFKQNNKIYQPTSSIVVDSLNINNIELGTLNLSIEGDNTFKKFTVNSSLESKNIESFLAQGNFSIENKDTKLDLDLRFDQFNLAAFSPIGGDVISNIRGFVSGNANIAGFVKKPEINGRLFLEKAGLTIPYINVDYGFKENSIVDLSENQFIFQNATIVDTKYNSEGKLNGTIKHKNFSNWNLDLAITADRLVALDTKDAEDAAYYGTAFIDGKATISGPTNGLLIAVNAKSRKGTEIKIPINNSEAVGNQNFIHFLSPLEKYNLEKGIFIPTKNYNGLELKFELDLTPEAEIEVILDRETGHGMKGKGNGTLLLEINTLGKFNMYGDYQVYEGTYNFKYKGLVDKRFEVKKFSSISWEGDPMRARLNLEAIYKANANPSVLIDNPSVNRKVPVEVGIAITGNLSSPEPDFNINFPTISSVLKSEIQTKLNDKDIRQTQALTLLATGGFLSNEGVNQNAVAKNLYETAGGIFDEIFQNTDDKFKVGIDIVSRDNTPGKESDGSIGFTVSTQINERISVNGKVGVPVGGINQSAIVGNVEIQYRVNEDGSLNLRVFNRESDINYIGEGIGYTQGLGLTYEVDFDTFSELVNKIFKNQHLAKEKKSNQDIPDSEITPDYIHFQDKKKKKNNDNPKPNIEVVPPKDE
jgi:hypothetical protein